MAGRQDPSHAEAAAEASTLPGAGFEARCFPFRQPVTVGVPDDAQGSPRDPRVAEDEHRPSSVCPWSCTRSAPVRDCAPNLRSKGSRRDHDVRSAVPHAWNQPTPSFRSAARSHGPRGAAGAALGRPVAVLVAPSATALAPVTRVPAAAPLDVPGPITDPDGALGSRTAEVQDALDKLSDDRPRPLRGLRRQLRPPGRRDVGERHGEPVGPR